MEIVLHRIEALPGEGRFAVTFRTVAGLEQTAVVETDSGSIEVADASLPTGWQRDGAGFAGLADAVTAFAQARTARASEVRLRDVAGGWDVGLGNVVLGADGVPECTAHGSMAAADGAFVCAECGARAVLA